MDNQIDKNQVSEKNSMAGIDFVSSIVLIAFSLGIILWSLKMPRPGGWSSAPGLLPLFLGACILFMSLSILISSIKNKGFERLITKCQGFSFSQTMSDTKKKRLLGITLLIALYIFGLLGRMPFELASFIYLVSTLYFFWRKGGRKKIILLSILIPLGMGALFKIIFAVIMPGGSIFDWLIYLKK
ncbi:MAG: tripartite tricarboxylate transporter TctB family protein [Deltaproteobacteria bacterium]|nr:tripartite tricarboxylate transporter TctB family protein [Deltaproteobacteria bacterium]